MTNSCSLAN